jgi:hypothetical protein
MCRQLANAKLAEIKGPAHPRFDSSNLIGIHTVVSRGAYSHAEKQSLFANCRRHRRNNGRRKKVLAGFSVVREHTPRSGGLAQNWFDCAHRTQDLKKVVVIVGP